MRRFDQFSLREWATLLPVQHALKQLRNDAWMAIYARQCTDELARFLADTRHLTGHDIALVIAFEQPWSLNWMLTMAKRHLIDTTVVVIDNSRQANMRYELGNISRAHGIPYLGLPANPTRHVNRSHGMAMSWMFRNVVRSIEPRTFAFLDHDLIPVRPISMSRQLGGGQPLYGMRLNSTWAWQLWAGYCIFDYAYIARRPLNFLYDFSLGLDTGGRNWHCLYRNMDPQHLRFAPSEVHTIVDPINHEHTSVQVIDDAWFHIGGISYNDNFRSKMQLCEHLSRAFAEGVIWDHILAGDGRCVAPDNTSSDAHAS